MKFLWEESDFHERVEGAPRTRSAFDHFCDVVLLLSALYFGAHLVAWWIR